MPHLRTRREEKAMFARMGNPSSNQPKSGLLNNINQRRNKNPNNKNPDTKNSDTIQVRKSIQIPPVLTVSDVKRINREAGQFFFSPESMKFFESRIETKGLLIKNRFFITSEQFISSTGQKAPRKFTVRELNRETGGITTVSKFNEISTKKEAIKFAEKQQ